MSSENTVQFFSGNLANVLGTEASALYGDYSTPYSNYSEDIKRQVATTAVLELIKAEVSSSSDSGDRLFVHLKHLDTYVEQVMATLASASASDS